jgi:uncharacterized protein YprB with RNaseH-like and TPR domain
MIAPVQRMRKREIVWLGTHRCRHGMTYLEHYNCYCTERPETTRVGFMDIETTDFKADWGAMICYSFMDDAGNFYEDRINFEDLRNKKIQDKNLVRNCIKDLKRFDVVVGYYHSGFDIKFIRTRAVANGISFPFFDSIHQKDVYYMVRNRFQLTRNSLENACKTLLGESDKTKLDRGVWRDAILCSDEKAMNYIVDHCRKDVTAVAKLYYAVRDYVKPMERSI